LDFAPGKVEPDRQYDRARAKHHQGHADGIVRWFLHRSAIRIEIGDPVLPADVDFQPIIRLRPGAAIDIRSPRRAGSGELAKLEPMSSAA
jgi:hypothetical protein